MHNLISHDVQSNFTIIYHIGYIRQNISKEEAVFTRFGTFCNITCKL